MKAWQRIEPTSTTKIGWRTMVTKTFLMPDGSIKEFQTNDQEGRHYAGLVALTKDLQVIVARQFRPGPEQIFEEIPGGGVDAEDGDDYQAAAERELLEETGYIPAKVTPLGTIYADAYNNATWHYFLAEGCELGDAGQALDDAEFVDVHLISIEQFFDNARNARMTDTEIAFLAYDTLKRIQLEEKAANVHVDQTTAGH